MQAGDAPVPGTASRRPPGADLQCCRVGDAQDLRMQAGDAPVPGTASRRPPGADQTKLQGGRCPGLEDAGRGCSGTRPPPLADLLVQTRQCCRVGDAQDLRMQAGDAPVPGHRLSQARRRIDSSAGRGRRPSPLQRTREEGSSSC
ncbi:hypothetical protein NDU88_000578 [Pleurodeles waltl]|uniref:Uncharacterized protein n=1 Tax=Pleurodeles waltl TaxID=8319 RepID=A0AAV7R4K1_PLEWA|nr:hypothetical protein NDU88_000578 [Pleurodeles waltl]